MNLATLLQQDYLNKRMRVIERMEDRKAIVYLDSASPQHPTIGIGFDVSNDSNLEEVLNAMSIDPFNGNGFILYNDLQSLFAQTWTNSTLATLQNNINQAYTTYRVAEGLQAAKDPQAEFRMTDPQIETAFNAIADIREKELHRFLEEYNIDLDGNSSNNSSTDLYSRLPRSRERQALLSLLYNSATHPTGHPNAGMPTTLTSGSGRGGNLVDALITGSRVAAWFEIRYATNAEDTGGIAKRRFYESQLFGLYDDISNPTAQEAQNIVNFLFEASERVYASYGGTVVSNNIEYMLAYEREWGLKETQVNGAGDVSYTEEAINSYTLTGSDAQLRWGDIFKPIANDLIVIRTGKTAQEFAALGIDITGEVNLGHASQWTAGTANDQDPYATIQPTYRTLYQISPSTATDPVLAQHQLGGINDLLVAVRDQSNYLAGLYGDDVLIGAGGADHLYGGYTTEENRSTKDQGNDFLFGLGGNDHLFGHQGNDHLEGGDGDDTYYFNGSTRISVGHLVAS